MLEVKQRWLEVLQKTSIFSRLTADQMAVVLSSLFYCEVEAGQTLVYEGEIGSELFIIVQGGISISVKPGEENIELGRIFLEKCRCWSKPPVRLPVPQWAILRVLCLKRGIFRRLS